MKEKIINYNNLAAAAANNVRKISMIKLTSQTKLKQINDFLTRGNHGKYIDKLPYLDRKHFK